MSFDLSSPPVHVREDSSCFSAGHLPRSLAFSPDGLLLLASTEQRSARVLSLPPDTFVDAAAEGDGAAGGGAAPPARPLRAPLARVCAVSEPTSLRAAAWFPLMSAADPARALFLTAAREQPLHLWDCLSGAPRGSYVAVDAADEVVGAHAAAFSADGALVLGGFERALCAWDAARPGRALHRWPTAPTRHASTGQRGVICALAPDPRGGGTGVAAGSFDGSLRGYDARTGAVTALYEDNGGGIVVAESGEEGAAEGVAAEGVGGGGSRRGVGGGGGGTSGGGGGTSGGGGGASGGNDGGAKGDSRSGRPPSRAAVTHAAFTADGSLLCAGRRRCGDVLVWDTRAPAAPLYRLQRDASSAQRLQFALDGASCTLATGSRDGALIFYDLHRGRHVRTLRGMPDAVAAVAMHPAGVAFAVATGQRARRGGTGGGSDSDSEPRAGEAPAPTLSMWRAVASPKEPGALKTPLFKTRRKRLRRRGCRC